MSHPELTYEEAKEVIGILPSHVPALAVLKPGVVTVYEDDGAVRRMSHDGRTAKADGAQSHKAEIEPVPVVHLGGLSHEACTAQQVDRYHQQAAKDGQGHCQPVGLHQG